MRRQKPVAKRRVRFSAYENKHNNSCRFHLRHHVCVLDAAGQILREGALVNTRPALAKLLADYPQATVALEAGTHSPWLSRFLQEHGATVLVANPRKLHAISRHERKGDRRDAQMLARLARVDPTLLHPIQHGTAPGASRVTFASWLSQAPDGRLIYLFFCVSVRFLLATIPSDE